MLALMRSPERNGKPSETQTEEKPVAASAPARLTAITSAPSPASSAEEERKKQEVLQQVTQAFNAPIAFYGKVVDQYGHPVPYADVGYTAADKFNASGSNYSGKTDVDGFFEISGIKGAGLLVGVGKQGYYPIEGKSSASFAYGIGPDSYRRSAPTKGNPAIFELHKMGETVPLIQVSSLQINVPKTGQSLNIDLATGQAGRGNLQLESWIGDASRRPFEWRYRLSVPGGGLIERTGEFDFEAPSDGYQAAVDVSMPTNAEKWSSDVTKSYFAKLPDGTYARFSINLYPGKRNFVVLEGYLSSTSGNRNLEFDPKKVIKLK